MHGAPPRSMLRESNPTPMISVGPQKQSGSQEAACHSRSEDQVDAGLRYQVAHDYLSHLAIVVMRTILCDIKHNLVV